MENETKENLILDNNNNNNNNNNNHFKKSFLENKETTFSFLIKNSEEIIKSLSKEEYEELLLSKTKNKNNSTEKASLSTKRTFTQRAFGRMEAGSLRGSIFAISSIALGTGCLSLPIRFTQLGLVGGIISLIIGASCAYWSLSAMITATKKSKETDYSRIVKDTLGIFPGYFLDGIILLYIFGVLISYLVVIYSLIGRVFFELSNNKNEYEQFEDFESEIWDKIIIKLPIMYGLCALLIPICLLKDISKMRFTSLFGIISLLYAIGVVVVQSFSFYNYYKENTYKKDDPSTHPNYFDITRALKGDLNIFSCLATIFFSYTCHIGAFPVYSTLKNNISRRINKVFRRSILLDTFIYISVGVAGFFTMPIDTPQLIIYRKSIYNNDFFMSLARAGIAISLILNTPPNYNSFRISFFEVFFKTNVIDNKKNFFVTVTTLVCCTSIAIVYKDILTYISLLGGFCSVIIAFLIPGLIYVKTNEFKLSHYKNVLSLMLVVLLCTIGWTAGMQSLIFL